LLADLDGAVLGDPDESARDDRTSNNLWITGRAAAIARANCLQPVRANGYPAWKKA
jgi:hypothetical protein